MFACLMYFTWVIFHIPHLQYGHVPHTCTWIPDPEIMKFQISVKAILCLFHQNTWFTSKYRRRFKKIIIHLLNNHYDLGLAQESHLQGAWNCNYGRPFLSNYFPILYLHFAPYFIKNKFRAFKHSIWPCPSSQDPC